MQVLAVFCLFGLGMGVPRPGFRYAYMIPQENENQPWSQFNERTDGHYAWGYEFPGRVHFESKDDTGVVKGSFGFIDANGNPNIWKYRSDPESGFQVETGVGETLTAAASAAAKADAKADAERAASVYSTRMDSPSPFTFTRAQLVESNISPLLKKAAEDGELVPAGSSSVGVPQFAVNPAVADEAGGISNLAYRFNAIPVAAVHDVQSRPSSFVSDSAFAPVLNHREEPDFTLYALEVPVQ